MKHLGLVLCGPTATGKTALALKIAKEVGGEIISADSRQIYREMNIGTGKELEHNSKFNPPVGGQNSKFQFESQEYQIGYYEVKGIKIWLYDIIAPSQRFSVAEYVPPARQVIRDLLDRGKRPIIVGGTGLYLDSIFKPRETFGIPPDLDRRRELVLKTRDELKEILRQAAPEKLATLNVSDQANPRRLIRAIEVAFWQKENSHGIIGDRDFLSRGDEMGNFIWIGLTAPLPDLYRRIDERVELMYREGLLSEIESLVRKYGWDAPGLNCIGYRQFRPYFEKKEPLAAVLSRIKFDSHAYCHRQLTWFKRRGEINWLDVRTYNPSDVIRIIDSIIDLDPSSSPPRD